MSVMNRKMFNRNARNKLNTMGGVASFQLGGSPAMRTNPAMVFSGTTMNPAQQLALQSYNKGLGTLDSDQLATLTREIFKRKAQGIPTPDISGYLGDSPLGTGAKGLEFVGGGIRDLLANVAGQVVGKTQSLAMGEPGSPGLAGRLGSARLDDETMKQLGFKQVPTTVDPGLQNAMRIQNIKPTISDKPPIAGGPTNIGDIDVTTASEFFDAARQDETKRVQELSKDGQPVRFNEKTGEYEPDPNFVNPEDAEEERGVASELGQRDVTMSPGRMQAQFGTTVLPRPKEETKDVEQKKIISPTDQKKIDESLKNAEDQIMPKKRPPNFGSVVESIRNARKDKPTVDADDTIEQEIEEGTSTPEDIKAEYLKLLPKYEEDPSVMGLNLALMGFAIAGGESSNALKNIADGMKKTLPNFIKAKEKKKAFERETELLASKFTIKKLNSLEAEARKKNEFFVKEDFTDPNTGKEYKAGQLLRLNEKGYNAASRSGLAKFLTNSTNMAQIIKGKADIESERVKASGAGGIKKGDFALKDRELFGVKYSLNVPTGVGNAKGFNVSRLASQNDFQKVQNAYFNEVNKINMINKGIKTAFDLADSGEVTGSAGMINKITESVKGFVPQSLKEDIFGKDYDNYLNKADRFQRLHGILSMQLAPILLGEGGKTISDNDRALVAQALGLQVKRNNDGRIIEITGFDNAFTSEAKVKYALKEIGRVMNERKTVIDNDFKGFVVEIGGELKNVEANQPKTTENILTRGTSLSLNKGEDGVWSLQGA